MPPTELINLAAEMTILNGEIVYDNGQNQVTTAVPGGDEIAGTAVTFSLEQNYPNPFNPSTTIRNALPSRSHITLTVFNPLGQIVRELVNGEMDAGYHEVQFDATGLASGIYFYRMRAGNFVETKRLLLLRSLLSLTLMAGIPALKGARPAFTAQIQGKLGFAETPPRAYCS
jgi:hypothetical protein